MSKNEQAIFCDLSSLDNESDVEQKLLYPLLTSRNPEGLGYADAEIKTKPNLRKLEIDKGTSKKIYHPDYAILQSRFPVLICEAKSPSENPHGGYREARLYAAEFNSRFPTGVNPCRFILSTNGRSILYGYWDQDSPIAEFDCADISASNIDYAKFVDTLCRDKLAKLADEIKKTFTPISKMVRPINLVGGVSVRNEEVGYNQFGATLSVDFVHLFNPQTKAQRIHIARNAYITSMRREHYTDEIDRLVKNALPRKKSGHQVLDDTDNPTALLRVLGRGKELQSKILLLVGSVGAGKSTFVDYFRAVKLPESAKANTLWISVDFKENPPSVEQLECWVIDRIIAGLCESEPEADFNQWETLQKIFGIEIREIKRGPLQLLKNDPNHYNQELFKEVNAIIKDRRKFASCLARYLSSERGKLLVLVFDNADKGNQEQQLQAFQLVQWIQSWLPCVIFLPLRDVTYENHKLTPPLDTIIKEYIFRIEPPQFTRVLKSRIMLALEELSHTSTDEKLSYTLDNGIKVVYPASEIGTYLAAIYKSLYDHDQIMRRMLVGLAGRNIRLAMEIFLDFCKSGHIGTKEILKIRITRGNYSLPYKVITRVLLRLSRRFYDGDVSHIKNLFQSSPDEKVPDHFVRFSILSWLRRFRKVQGPSGVRGFHRVSTLCEYLVSMGVSLDNAFSSLLYLIKSGCVYTEQQRVDQVGMDELVILAPAGYATLGLVGHLDYMAACSEDTWIQDVELGSNIALRIGKHGLAGHYNRLTTRLNASEFSQYLLDQSKQYFQPSEIIQDFAAHDIHAEIVLMHDRVRRDTSTEEASDVWHQFSTSHEVGDEAVCRIDGVKDFGVFARFENGPTGLIHERNLPPGIELSQFIKGGLIRVEIVRIDRTKERVDLQFLEFC
jgi:hypothetical protein